MKIEGTKTYLDNKQILKSDEYLLKTHLAYDNTIKGYLTKLNQDNSIPINFLKWPVYSRDLKDHFKIVTEEFKEGWQIFGSRYGESQNWAVMMHPDGYTVEIYMDDLLEVIKNITIENGILEGKYKWSNKKLIKK